MATTDLQSNELRDLREQNKRLQQQWTHAHRIIGSLLVRLHKGARSPGIIVTKRDMMYDYQFEASHDIEGNLVLRGRRIEPLAHKQHQATEEGKS